MLRNKRLLAAAVLATFIAGVFWSQSRIPALNEKAQMGLRTSFGEIAFDVVLPVTPEQSLPERVLRSSVNWAYTNKQGMTFGMLFAAAVLTILANVRRRQFRKPWQNAVSGVLIGAPLGVCVNCATPIAFGIYSAGARLETALASLVASPTLNVIVLTMAFTLLPIELALAKLAGVALVVALIPVIVRRFAGAPDLAAANVVASKQAARMPVIDVPADPPPGESFGAASVEVAKQFGASLWFLIRFALPMMILAGLLGSLAIEIVPFEMFGGRQAALGTIALAALVGTFLPVPIAFDVIVVMALLSSGVDVGIAMALLFSLGIYSIYPAAMIGRYVSGRLSVVLGVLVTIIAVALGMGMQAFFADKASAEAETISEGLTQTATSLVSDSAAICEQLPASLRGACFVRKLDALGAVAADNEICDYGPPSLDPSTCRAELERLTVTREAISQLQTSQCSVLADSGSRSRCIFSVTLRMAQKDYDPGRCDVLPDPDFVARCRAEYINASLLFNPDDTACAVLLGAERDDCLTNAAIYRHADTLNIAACDSLEPVAARDHCRYTVASTMIGRHNDASGCAAIQSDALAQRCNAQVIAWDAERQLSLERCDDIAIADLRDSCLLRTSGQVIDRMLSRSVYSALPAVSDSVDPDYPLPTTVPAVAPALDWRAITEEGDAEFRFSRYRDASGSSGRFDMIDAGDIGIDATWQFRITDFFEPFIIGKGIASGDFNSDGWPDLVLATSTGVRLYRNVGGRFSRVALEQGELASGNVFLVALVDIDGDGNQDIFATAYGGRNYVLRNLDGAFTRTSLDVLEGQHRLTMSAGFADLDTNAELDIVLGNWSSGLEKLFATGQSRNTVLMQESGRMTPVLLDEVKGETNSVLVTDLDDDGRLDIMIGNDRLVPDLYYLGDDSGGFRQVTPADGLVPVTSMFTMSLEAADFDNDLRNDIFSTDMTFARSSRSDYCAAFADARTESRCRELLRVYDALTSEGPSSCENLQTGADRQACFVAFSIKAARDLQDDSFCDALQGETDAVVSLCHYLGGPVEQENAVDLSDFLPQSQRNTLLFRTDGAYEERAESLGVSSSYWSWNAKAADLDNDGWQDIYVGNGFHFGENFYEIQENIAFRNTGAGFVETQSAWGLDDPVNTPSYTYVDFDLDGDLDIIASGVLSPPRVFVNNLGENHAVTFILEDEVYNRDAIGAEIVISYGGEDELEQMRTINLSGGFLSFNNAVAHFGLGEYDRIDRVEVTWPEGYFTVIDEPLAADGIYRIRRFEE